MTQIDKIKELCKDGEYHCQNEFRNLYIYSPHKRRSEIEEQGEYIFIKRKCEHGISGQFDYKMIEKPKEEKPIIEIKPVQTQLLSFNRIKL